MKAAATHVPDLEDFVEPGKIIQHVLFLSQVLPWLATGLSYNNINHNLESYSV